MVKKMNIITLLIYGKYDRQLHLFFREDLLNHHLMPALRKLKHPRRHLLLRPLKSTGLQLFQDDLED